MRMLIGGLILGAGLVFSITAFCLQQNAAFAQLPTEHRPPRVAGANDLIALSTTVAEGRQQITLIDPKTRAMAVYHVEPGSGSIVLKSVRRIYWDLQIDEFNGVSPSPREVRALMERP